MATELQLTLGIARTPLTGALFDQRVQPAGIRLACLERFGTGPRSPSARHRAILAGQADGGEFSTSSYILARARGAPLCALPIFLNRGFVHRAVFCRSDAPYQSPADLAGKRVAVHRYNNTVAVWARGLLEDEYGVPPEALRWFVSEEDLPGEVSPPGVQIERIPGTAPWERAVDLVREAGLDAVIEAFLRPGDGLRRILADHRSVEMAYARRIGVFPIFHTLVLRSDLIDEHPGIVDRLLSAFREAGRRAPSYASDSERAKADWEREVLGEDPYAHRLGPGERRTLEALVASLVRQGLLQAPMPIDALFAPTGPTRRDGS